MQQYRSLFDKSEQPAKLSRRSDQITSQQSAAETEKKLPKRQAELLIALHDESVAVTAREAARQAALMFEGMEDTYRKRMLDLVRDGHAKEAGERRCEITGKNAMTFRVRGQR